MRRASPACTPSPPDYPPPGWDRPAVIFGLPFPQAATTDRRSHTRGHDGISQGTRWSFCIPKRGHQSSTAFGNRMLAQDQEPNVGPRGTDTSPTRGLPVSSLADGSRSIESCGMLAQSTGGVGLHHCWSRVGASSDDRSANSCARSSWRKSRVRWRSCASVSSN